MGKYCRAGEDTDEKMAHAPMTLGSYGNKHTLSEYVIRIATMVARRRASMLRYAYIACLADSRLWCHCLISVLQ